ncbi:MAG TPA: hypothetical protein VFM93_00410 [Candidatus Limnocylindria bacterium]|nr:hypothetical protein [Candidatus Limnocylindria bacterium]
MLRWDLIVPALLLSALLVAGVLVVAARGVPALRRWLVVVAIGVATMPVAILLHNVLSAILDTEEGVLFVIGITVAPLCIAAGIVGGAAVLLRERRDLGIPVAIAAGGLALFALSSLLNLVVTTIWGEQDYQIAFNAVTVPLATTAAVVGALWSLLALVVGRRRTATV